MSRARRALPRGAAPHKERRWTSPTIRRGITFAEFARPSHTLMFTHPKVPPSHENKGIATRLIEAGLKAARQEGLKVIPACAAFAHSVCIYPDVRDLVEPGYVLMLGLDRT